MDKLRDGRLIIKKSLKNILFLHKKTITVRYSYIDNINIYGMN